MGSSGTYEWSGWRIWRRTESNEPNRSLHEFASVSYVLDQHDLQASRPYDLPAATCCGNLVGRTDGDGILWKTEPDQIVKRRTVGCK